MSGLDSFGSPLDRRAWVSDFALTGLLLVALVGPYIVFGAGQEQTSSIVLTGSVMILPLIIRRRFPLTMMLLVFLGGVLQAFVVSMPVMSICAVPLASYSVARWVPGSRARVVLVFGLVGSVLGPTRWMRIVAGVEYAGPGRLVPYLLMVGICAGLVVTPYAIGRRIRESALILAQQETSAAQRSRAMLAAREQTARMAEVQARAQIARELHDIVAHSVSVMIVQAEGGKALALKKPEAALEVLDTIAETGREALTEMRRILGVLRADPAQSPGYEPTPGLGDIADMVARSGNRVHLTVSGELSQVPPALGLTAYRVVQEAMTNVFKHAGPTAVAEVRLICEPEQVTVDVSDDGVGAAAFDDGKGSGLRGMRERVASMGGLLEARPRRSGGFLVRATLPLPQAVPGAHLGAVPANPSSGGVAGRADAGFAGSGSVVVPGLSDVGFAGSGSVVGSGAVDVSVSDLDPDSCASVADHVARESSVLPDSPGSRSASRTADSDVKAPLPSGTSHERQGGHDAMQSSGALVDARPPLRPTSRSPS